MYMDVRMLREAWMPGAAGSNHFGERVPPRGQMTFFGRAKKVTKETRPDDSALG